MTTIVDADAQTVLDEQLAAYEDETGDTLRPADPRRMVLAGLSLLLSHQRALINWSARQNMVDEVSSVHIDGIGTLWGLTRAYGEAVEDFRARIVAEPGETRVAGPTAAYKAIVQAISSEVLDVALDPQGAQVDVYITQTGTIQASAELIGVVEAALQGDTARVLGDYTPVFSASIAAYNLEGEYFIARSRADAESEIRDEVTDAVDAWHTWQSAIIGRWINPSQLVARVLAAGAKRVELVTPTTHTTLTSTEVALVSYDALAFGGVEDD